jgi:hypothetical protein
MPYQLEGDPDLGSGLAPGAAHYRAYVGPPEKYDRMAALQFNLLTFLGLREHHSLLDLGCGSLRAGRLFIPYLLPGRYCGLEPERWLVEEGIRQEVGQDLIRLKRPTFRYEADFTLTAFGRQFDFLLAQSVFSHAAERQIHRCLGEARQVLGPESVFAASFALGKTNYTGTEWVYPGCSHYTLEHMRMLARANGLECRPIPWPHWALVWVVFTRPENARDYARACVAPPV